MLECTFYYTNQDAVIPSLILMRKKNEILLYSRTINFYSILSSETLSKFLLTKFHEVQLSVHQHVTFVCGKAPTDYY